MERHGFDEKVVLGLVSPHLPYRDATQGRFVPPSPRMIRQDVVRIDDLRRPQQERRVERSVVILVDMKAATAATAHEDGSHPRRHARSFLHSSVVFMTARMDAVCSLSLKRRMNYRNVTRP